MPPVLPADLIQFYLPPARGKSSTLVYKAALLGFAEVSFLVDKRTGRSHVDSVRLLAAPTASGHPAAWDDAATIGESLEEKPRPGASWESVPASLDTGKKMRVLEKAFLDHLAATKHLELFENRTLKLVSNVGETLNAFHERCRLAAEDEKVKALEMEKLKFGPKFEALDSSLPEDEPKSKKGGGFLSKLFGGSSGPDPDDKAEARRLDKVRKLNADYQAKRNEIIEKWKRVGTEATPLQVKAKKTDIRVTHFGLAWLPHWRGPKGDEAAYR
jgi:hypothetical protein